MPAYKSDKKKQNRQRQRRMEKELTRALLRIPGFRVHTPEIFDNDCETVLP
jgi:hypothetical protein